MSLAAPFLNTSEQISTPEFSPYVLNGGTIVALAGPDFAIAASDTRLSEGFQIFTRDNPKLYRISENTVLASTGCLCDVLTLVKNCQARSRLYEYEFHKPMTTNSTAQMLSTMLYYKRFFPYYAYNLVAGLDENGKGAIYSYDPVGSYEREEYRAAGTGADLVQPLLDNQIGQKHHSMGRLEGMSLERGRQIVVDTFISASERDIYTGDGIAMSIVNKDGVNHEHFKLRRD